MPDTPCPPKRYIVAVIALLTIGFLAALSIASQSARLKARKDADRYALSQILHSTTYDNDLLSDVVRMPSDPEEGGWVKAELLGLRQDRLAYLVRNNGEVTTVIVPATAEDGFNGYVDLLVAVDMFGRIQEVSVVETPREANIYGVVNLIESQWIKLFAGNTFRDIQRLSWQTIPADKEYDLFVGASVTPKTVSAKIYDALIFFQSNRIAFLKAGDS